MQATISLYIIIILITWIEILDLATIISIKQLFAKVNNCLVQLVYYFAILLLYKLLVLLNHITIRSNWFSSSMWIRSLSTITWPQYKSLLSVIWVISFGYSETMFARFTSWFSNLKINYGYEKFTFTCQSYLSSIDFSFLCHFGYCSI